MHHRFAKPEDLALLAELNYQLIRDEGHRNNMTVSELEKRMQTWLASEYVAVLFGVAEQTVAYALYREQPDEVYLRQFFVIRERRRQGIGRAAVGILRHQIWPPHKRLSVEVLVQNVAAVAFWHSVGYRDYSLALEILPDVSTPPASAAAATEPTRPRPSDTPHLRP